MNGLGYAQSQGPGLVSMQYTQQELRFFVKRGAKLVWPYYEQIPNTRPPPLHEVGGQVQWDMAQYWKKSYQI